MKQQKHIMYGNSAVPLNLPLDPSRQKTQDPPPVSLTMIARLNVKNNGRQDVSINTLVSLQLTLCVRPTSAIWCAHVNRVRDPILERFLRR